MLLHLVFASLWLFLPLLLKIYGNSVCSNSLCYIISLFSYILWVRFGNRVWGKPRKKTVLTSQIIEGWASHDPLSRTRLYFIYFQTCFCLSGTGFALILTEDFVSFFQVSRWEIDKIECSKYTRFKRECR